MERYSQRQSVILGYIPERSDIDHSSSPKAADRSSDIDFNDVFGGPPRRSSMHEIRCSYSEATDNETVVSRNSWNGVSEKPVFGEEGLSRRHYPSDNFFGDIFKGNGSLSSSPRKRDWDPYASSPGSRVLSPAPTLPPKAEPFGTSPPPQFSLPAKLSKGMELSTFGSAPHSPYKSKEGASNCVSHYSSHLLRSSSLNRGYEERNDTRSSFRQSILSRESSLGIGDANIDTGGDSKMESNSSEVLTSGNQFHFSIYKWASKGVPLVMPLRGGNNSKSKENQDTDRCSSADGWIESERELPTETLNDTKLPSNDGASADIKCYTEEHDIQNNSIPPETSTQDRVETWPRADSGDTSSYKTGEKTKSHSQSEMSLHNKLENVSVVTEECHKPELQPLCSLFYEQSNEEISKNTSEKESKVKDTKKPSVVPDFSKNKKKQDGKRDSAEVGKGSRQGSPMNSRDSGKTRAKGMVKEFIKIFSQESLSKSKVSVNPQSQSSRWKDIVNSKAEMEAKFKKTATNAKIHMSSEHEKKSFPNTPVKSNGNLPHSEKHESATTNTSHMSNLTSGQNDSSSSANGLKAVNGDIDQSFHGKFLVKDLTQDEDKLRSTCNDPQDIQVIDVKIRKWSNGKEGNIRSLLSTLQYVLWPESGWKPVPLVDIIDGNAVKRSYQKALLCLHPDKLQQKGASSEQKYTAEKVFDILQDAWTHFNLLGSL